jgi:hypothetical protein
MKDGIKVGFADTVLMTNGEVARVIEFDNQPPYTIRVGYKERYTGEFVRRWIRTEDVKQVLPKVV